MRYLTLLLGCSLLLCFCAPPDQSNETMKSPELSTADTLNQVMENLWNAGNADSISAWFSDEVTFLYNGGIIIGKDSVTKQWVEQDAPAMRNLKTEAVTRATSHGMIFYAGQYEHDAMTEDDTLAGPFKGQYTFVWKKQKNEDWNLRHMHLQQTHSPKSGMQSKKDKMKKSQ